MRPGAVLELGPCRGCGYDLRGLKPGGSCPECGTRIPSGNATFGGEEGRLADEAAVGLGWIAKAALWPVPIAFGCAQLSGWIGGPILVATTGFSWLRLLGVRKVATATAEVNGRPATLAAATECGLAVVLAASVFFASAGWMPIAVPSVALVAWILAATAATVLARRLTAATVVAAGGGSGSGILETVGSTGLVAGGAALALGRAVAPAAGGTIPNAALDALLLASLAAGLLAAAAGAMIWISTARLADELPSMPRFRPKRLAPMPHAVPPRPEPAPLEVSAPRPIAEREPIELEPPTIAKPAAPAPPSRNDEGGDDDELWNGWKN